jgi:hypothetical protein
MSKEFSRFTPPTPVVASGTLRLIPVIPILATGTQD